MDKALLAGLCSGCFLLQSSIIPFFFQGSYQPDIWLVVIVMASMIFSTGQALLFAIIGGLIQDLVISNFFGLHLVPYIIITYGFSMLGKGKYNRHWYISMIAVAIGTVVFIVSSYFIMILGGINSMAFSYFLYTGIFLVGLNAIFVLFFHKLLWSLSSGFEGESRW